MMGVLKEYLGFIIAAAAVAGIVSGGLAYFAKASELADVRVELAQTQQRLDQKIVSDQLFDTQKRMWSIEERNREHGADCRQWPDARDREEYRLLGVQLDELKAQKAKHMKEPQNVKVKQVN